MSRDRPEKVRSVDDAEYLFSSTDDDDEGEEIGCASLRRARTRATKKPLKSVLKHDPREVCNSFP